MWSFSKATAHLFMGVCAVLFLMLLSGCMSDRPSDTDIPWSAPAGWEGVMPLPGGFTDRN